MLHTIADSGAKKTKGIAVTYRAGKGNMFGTCPADCKMNDSGNGTKEIDREYFAALLDAVPHKGHSFTYTHFPWHLWADQLAPGKTVVNYSTESITGAAAAARVVPTVVVVREDDWHGQKTIKAPLFGASRNGDLIQTDAVPIVRCPAEYRDNFSCRDCGAGLPLCARADRGYIIGFTAHGVFKRKAEDSSTRGGCYAAGGKVRYWWEKLANWEGSSETDAEHVRRFVKGLPPGSIVRHHVAGDIGQE